MATVSKSTMTLVGLWRMFRGAEDAMRFYSDIISSVIAQRGRESGNGSTIPGIDPRALEVLAEDWEDPPPCRPPGPCTNTPEELCERLRKIAARVNAMAIAGCALTTYLGQTQKEIVYYASTVPGAYWKETKRPGSAPSPQTG